MNNRNERRAAKARERTKQKRVKKTPPAAELDPNIVALVEALNAFKGVETIGSCGGHQDPGPGQEPAGEWIVIFRLAPDEHGWRALEFLAWLVNNNARRRGSKLCLEPFAAPPYLNTPGESLVFHLTGRGGEDPEGFARMLDESRRQSYIPPRSGRAKGG
jgi:hypothetical protein